MKVGDLVRMKYEARQYDNHLRVREMKEGSLGIIIEIITPPPRASKEQAPFAQVFVDGHTWELNLDYFERVQ